MKFIIKRDRAYMRIKKVIYCFSICHIKNDKVIEGKKPLFRMKLPDEDAAKSVMTDLIY